MSERHIYCKRRNMGTLNFRNIYQSAYHILTNGSIVLYEGRNSFSLTRGQFCEKKNQPCVKKSFLAEKFISGSLLQLIPFIVVF